VLQRYVPRLKPYVRQQFQPLVAAKKTLNMAVVLDARLAVALSQQVRVIDNVGAVGWVRIPGPFQVAQSALISIATTVIGAGSEVLPDMIRSEECGAAGPAVHKR
jgi:hypothetical protein